MRIKRDIFSILMKLKEWFFVRFKPLTIHTEAIMVDEVWEEIKKQVLKGSVLKWYVMTPENIDYYKAFFNIKTEKNKLSKIMKERYLWMIDHNQKLELHIHLSLIMKTMTYTSQEKIFKDSINWMKKELGITPLEFVPGWWSYDDNTLKVCKKFNLKMIKQKDYDFSHDYYSVLDFVRTES